MAQTVVITGASAGIGRAAARKIEEHLGPVDVWVNCGFTSVFAPFSKISAEEYQRVTQVSYLGFVHGCRTTPARWRRSRQARP